MKGDLKINDFLIPDSSLTYRPGWIEFEKTGRTVNNTLVSDFVGTKRKFKLEWSNWISGDFLDYIIPLFETKEDVTFHEFNKDNVDVSFICKLSIPLEYVREYKESNFAFSGFYITLEEV